ncbi:hypothetical protein GCM10028799_02050 [Kribbella italica]
MINSRAAIGSEHRHWNRQPRPRPAELFRAPGYPHLPISDELTVKHLRGRSWQGQAIAELGVEICVVRIPDDLVRDILAAQERQFR